MEIAKQKEGHSLYRVYECGTVVHEERIWEFELVCGDLPHVEYLLPDALINFIK